ncbi:MAG: hypothetical protein M5U07_25085 [Xanthobacteraceae bacterium]|nr:hypothetical protein [Xanthobacteraceae bacterium]
MMRHHDGGPHAIHEAAIGDGGEDRRRQIASQDGRGVRLVAERSAREIAQRARMGMLADRQSLPTGVRELAFRRCLREGPGARVVVLGQRLAQAGDRQSRASTCAAAGAWQ